MNETPTAPAKRSYPVAQQIVDDVVAGKRGIYVWTIDAANPPEGPCCEFPRIGRIYVYYTDDSGRWIRIPYQNAKAAAVLEALKGSKIEMIEWATAYDDMPRDADEEPFGVGPSGKQKLMAYRGRLWQDVPVSANAQPDPFDECVECEINDFSMADVGSVCYYEKDKAGVFQMVIG